MITTILVHYTMYIVYLNLIVDCFSLLCCILIIADLKQIYKLTVMRLILVVGVWWYCSLDYYTFDIQVDSWFKTPGFRMFLPWENHLSHEILNSSLYFFFGSEPCSKYGINASHERRAHFGTFCLMLYFYFFSVLNSTPHLHIKMLRADVQCSPLKKLYAENSISFSLSFAPVSSCSVHKITFETRVNMVLVWSLLGKNASLFSRKFWWKFSIDPH